MLENFYQFDQTLCSLNKSQPTKTPSVVVHDYQKELYDKEQYYYFKVRP